MRTNLFRINGFPLALDEGSGRWSWSQNTSTHASVQWLSICTVITVTSRTEGKHELVLLKTGNHINIILNFQLTYPIPEIPGSPLAPPLAANVAAASSGIPSTSSSEASDSLSREERSYV